jgi:hypothetical protein
VLTGWTREKREQGKREERGESLKLTFIIERSS